MTKIGAVQGKDYVLKEAEDSKYFPGRGGEVILDGQKIGTIGVLHPEVMEHFGLKNPVSTYEIEFEPVWYFFKNH